MEVVEELDLTDADRAAGVTWQAMVKLGDKWRGEPIRVLRVVADGTEKAQWGIVRNDYSPLPVYSALQGMAK